MCILDSIRRKNKEHIYPILFLLQMKRTKDFNPNVLKPKLSVPFEVRRFAGLEGSMTLASLTSLELCPVPRLRGRVRANESSTPPPDSATPRRPPAPSPWGPRSGHRTSYIASCWCWAGWAGSSASLGPAALRCAEQSHGRAAYLSWTVAEQTSVSLQSLLISH